MVKEGGDISRTNDDRHLEIKIPEKPDFPGQIPDSFEVAYRDGKIVSNWRIDESGAPPFSFLLQVHDNPDYSGTPVYEKILQDPEARGDVSQSLSLPDRIHYARLVITDIFEEKSTVRASFPESITTRQAVKAVSPSATFQIREQTLCTRFHLPRPLPVRLDIIDMQGRVFITREWSTLPAGQADISTSLQGLDPGLYSARLSIGSRREIRIFIMF